MPEMIQKKDRREDGWSFQLKLGIVEVVLFNVDEFDCHVFSHLKRMVLNHERNVDEVCIDEVSW